MLLAALTAAAAGVTLAVGWDAIHYHVDKAPYVAGYVVSNAVSLAHGPPDEAARLRMVDELKEHAVYKKFKATYPDSEEAWGLHDFPFGLIRQADGHGNTLVLQIAKGLEVEDPSLLESGLDWECGSDGRMLSGDWSVLDVVLGFLDGDCEVYTISVTCAGSGRENDRAHGTSGVADFLDSSDCLEYPMRPEAASGPGI